MVEAPWTLSQAALGFQEILRLRCPRPCLVEIGSTRSSHWLAPMLSVLLPWLHQGMDQLVESWDYKIFIWFPLPLLFSWIPQKIVGWFHEIESLGLLPRHINHYTMEAFYDLYKMYCVGQGIESSEIASNRRFRDIYDQQWRRTLCMRELSQHARLGLGSSWNNHSGFA
jgi:hypothetical protein